MINKLLRDIERNGYNCTGKLEIIQCGSHYRDKEQKENASPFL